MSSLSGYPVVPPPPSLAGGAEAARLRHIFQAAGFEESRLFPLLGDPTIPAAGSATHVHVLHATEAPSDFHALVRLFVLGREVERAALERLLPFGAVESLVRAGLLLESGDRWQAAVALMPYDGLLVAFDCPRLAKSGGPADVVMSLTGSTLAVARSAVRLPRRRTLDLGTGNGYLALAAARWSGQVVGTDLNARALDFARFNAALNGVDNVEFRLGDRFAPVEGERFDQILCNPPFAITPRSRYMYCDGGEALDGYCRRLAREAPQYLAEDGIFQMVCEWVQREGQEAESALAEWFTPDAGCDVFVWRDETRDPLLYAEEWLLDTEGRIEGELDQWVKCFEQERVSAIHTGYVLMRRRRTRTPVVDWFHLDEAPRVKTGEFGEQFWRAVASRDFLRAYPSNDSLLQAAVRPAPELTLRQECEWQPGGWRVTSTKLRLASGMGREAEIDQKIMGLIARCNGNQPLVDIVLEMARALGISSDALIEPSMRVVRALIEQGFLVPEPRRRTQVN